VSRHDSCSARLKGPVRVALATLLALPVAGAAAPAPAEPFAVAGISRAEAAEFLARLQQAVRDEDAGAVAALTHFPLTVNGRAGAASPDEFRARYGAIFNARVRATVLAQGVDGMFANWKGLIVGRGEVWISVLCEADSPPGTCSNRRILVNSVNNAFPASP
jgi:hypothetical protein